MKEKLLTTREVSHILGISEKDIIELTEAGKIPHFKVAGEYLRFKKEDILRLKRDIQRRYNISREKINFFSRVKDFFYFYDFYIFSSAIIIFLLWIILKNP